MTRPLLRLLVLGAALGPILCGCDSKAPSAKTVTSDSGDSSESLELSAINTLESKSDFEQCRTVLRQLDAQERSIKDRGTLPEARRDELKAALQLTPDDLTELTQVTFTQTDAIFLEESLLIASAMRSLDLKKLPPMARATQGFHWVCRMTYLDERFPLPGPPWFTLQAGCGTPMARAYAVLAVWKQLGIDGAIVGPADLKTAPSPKGPVKGVAAAIDGKLYLFDILTGKPVVKGDGKSVATLDEWKADPKAPAEAKTWNAYVVAPVSGLTQRIAYLEKLLPNTFEVKLTWDLPAFQAKFQLESACHAAGDLVAFTRVHRAYAADEGDMKNEVPINKLHRLKMVPIDQLPKIDLYGEVLDYVRNGFVGQFMNLRLAANSPMDKILRGQFKDATAYLSDTRAKGESAAERFARDTGLKADFARWAGDIQRLDANVAKAQRSKDASAVEMARTAMGSFMRNPQNADILYAIVMGTASGPLLAETTYLLALCIHEKAEVAVLRGLPAEDLWKNAAEWWVRYETAAKKVPGLFKERDAHAKALATRCDSQIPK
jgi:hypothetical protein